MTNSPSPLESASYRFFRLPSLALLPLPFLEAAMVIALNSGFVGARFSIDYASPFLVVFWRCVVVTLFLLPFVMSELRRTSFSTLIHYAGIGLLATSGYLLGGVQGIALGVPAGLAALLADLLPVGTAILATTILKQRLTIRAWLGLGIGLLGVVLVTRGAFVLGEAPLWAYLLPFFGMMSLAVATIWQKHSDTFSSISLITNLWIQSLVSAILFAFVASTQTSLAPVPSTGFIVSVLWTAAISSMGGYGLYWLCLRRSSPTRVATVLYLSPAVTLLWAWAMFDEPLSWLMALGVAISMFGIWIVIREEKSSV
jgi:drug/metabolite transporter (DMT)-like permease